MQKYFITSGLESTGTGWEKNMIVDIPFAELYHWIFAT